MLNRSLSLVLRSTFLVRNFGKLESVSGPESLFDPAYTGNHIVQFECQLKTPSALANIDHGLLDFFKLQKISMSNWRIVDVDFFMKGNSFFNKMVNELDWHNDVISKIGTHEKRNVNVKEQDQVKESNMMIDIYKNYINLKEPRYNRGLEEFKSKDELEVEKKEAKEKAMLKLKEMEEQKKAAGKEEVVEEEPEVGEKKEGKKDKK